MMVEFPVRLAAPADTPFGAYEVPLLVGQPTEGNTQTLGQTIVRVWVVPWWIPFLVFTGALAMVVPGLIRSVFGRRLEYVRVTGNAGRLLLGSFWNVARLAGVITAFYFLSVVW